MCAHLASTVQDLKGEVSRHEESMASMALQVRTLEASVDGLTKSSEGLTIWLQGTIP